MSWFLSALLLAGAPLQAGTAAPGTAGSAVFEQGAAAAWQQFNRLWQASSGLANATPGYTKLTSWDIGSVLAALFSARQLGLLPEAEYQRRLGRTLATLERMPLYRGAAFHKMYNSRDGKMASRGGGPTTRGYGWSATDLGRLLVWLRIIAENEPAQRARAQRIAARMKYDQIVSGGYLHGEELTRQGKTRRFQEGRAGYEQYAARGFGLWGHPVDAALDLSRHTRPVNVLGVPLLADVRGLDRIVSEPFVLMGLELGWSEPYGTLARNVLAAQEARYRQTGIVTMASEDAVALPPYYFYYYCIYCNGKPFVIDVADPGKTLDKPRWVSTKTAFAWHALVGSAYTALAVQTVLKGTGRGGLASGVYEKSTRSTGSHDINTAAVVLEAAAYARLKRPLIRAKS